MGSLLVAGCDGEERQVSYVEEVTQERVQRDMEMRSKRTVIPPQRREDFRGLQYYPVDTTYRYEVALQRFPQPDTVLIAQSTGGVAPQVRVGRVGIPFSQDSDTLTVFKITDGEEAGQLWTPFTDATNGSTTYSAGRYVDLRAHDGDSVVVDFNRAYNPTCTYNPDYACPIPPGSNDLPFPIPAGEQNPLF